MAGLQAPNRRALPVREKGGGILKVSTATLNMKVETPTSARADVQETPVEVNERGFMTDLSQWTPGAALYLARRQGLRDWPRELTSDHWRIIDYMRVYYNATGNAPSLRYTCRALDLTKRQFSRLFPGGLMTARRISGLPGPRRAANRRELSIAQQLLARNWWEQLTSVEPEDDTKGRKSRVVAGAGVQNKAPKPRPRPQQAAVELASSSS
jgi:TusE/DsrC/DsvC family sulfur relay protein